MKPTTAGALVKSAALVRSTVALAAAILLAAATAGAAAPPEKPSAETPPAEAGQPEAADPGGATLTNNWFGAGDRLAEQGLTLKLSATQVFQDMARGGVFTHRHAGRYSGRYDFEVEGDLERLARVQGGSFYILAEGGWSGGIENVAIANHFNPNGVALGTHSVRVQEFWYQQSLLDDRVSIRIGKIDLTGTFECHTCPGSFDGNTFANDETTQFLNAALVNNPTIPFPERGLGAVVFVRLTDSWYASAGVGDAKAREGQTGFNTAFEDPHETLSLYETGYVAHLPSANGPLHGAYRVGMWYDTVTKDRFDGEGVRRGDTGLYVSMDQVFLKETNDPNDEQGLGAFARFGFADAAVNPVKFFWSAGGQYRGLLPGRDADVLALGVAQGRLSDAPGAGFTARSETAIETYYSVEVTPWLHVGPSIQYIFSPGGLREARDALVVGIRIRAAF
jgi:porin